MGSNGSSKPNPIPNVYSTDQYYVGGWKMKEGFVRFNSKLLVFDSFVVTSKIVSGYRDTTYVTH